MNKKTTFLLVAVMAIAVGAAFYLKRGSSAKDGLKPFQALGTITAQETVKLVGDQGPVVLVVPDFGGTAVPTFDAQLNAFKAEIQKHPAITVAGVETIKVGAPESASKSKSLKFAEPMAAARGPAGPQQGQLGELVANYQQAKALIYFVDLPDLNSGDVAALKQRGTKLIAISDWRPSYKSLFADNLLQVCVVPKPQPETGRKPRDTKDWFDQSYSLVTADNATSQP